MATAPGTDDCAYLSFIILDELINTLVENGVLAHSDVCAMFSVLSEGVHSETLARNTSAGPIIKRMMAERCDLDPDEID